MYTKTQLLALPREAVMALRRQSVRIMGIFVLAAVVLAGWTYVQHKNDNSLSSEFRSSAQQAFRAINICENYKLKHGDSYQTRELEAEKALATRSRRVPSEHLLSPSALLLIISRTGVRTTVQRLERGY